MTDSTVTKAQSESPVVQATELAGTYESSRDAMKEIEDAFNYWSGQISATSLQLCYAVVAANWVIFGSINKIIHSQWAIWSLTTVLLALAFNLVVAYGLAEWMRCRFGYAESDRKRWEAEFQREKNGPSKWPYTKHIERVSIAIRLVKVVLPLVSGILLIIGTLRQ